MATLILTDLLDDLIAALDSARIVAASDSRWQNAINLGYDWLLQQDAIEFDATCHELTLTSPESGNTYRANGVCQCEAFSHANPCWHRCAARLVRRALERQQHAQRTQAAQQLVNQIAAQRARVLAEIAECF